MRAVGSGDRWAWTAGYSASINFCVWVLVQDGLRVAPFDKHPDGSGSLRAAGLGPAEWRAWLEAVFAQSEEIARARAAGTITDEFLSQMRYAPGAWQGGEEIGGLLAQLWEQYESYRPLWEQRVRAGFPPDLAPSEDRRLWRELQPLHARIPSPHVLPVEYPVPVYYLLPHACVLIGPAEMDGDTFCRVTRAAFFRLAEDS